MLVFFIGDLKNEAAVIEWLIHDDNRELEDEIEAVNSRMLDKLLDTSPFIAVFFCKLRKRERNLFWGLLLIFSFHT